MSKFCDRMDWTPDEVMAFYDEIEKIGLEKYKLDIYPNKIQLVKAEHMVDAYAFHGLPIMYPHWSFGRDFIQNMTSYQKGLRGLAYEMVINSNPCISYLMEENTTMMQVLVLAHACMGHNHFFKNNNLMRTWTDAEFIVPYLNYAKAFIEECEDKHGIREVEAVISAAHSLRLHGIDKYKRPPKLSVTEAQNRINERRDQRQKEVNEIWKTIPNQHGWIPEHETDRKEEDHIPREPQENLLYFLEKTAPNLKSWEREIIRIVRKVAQYFYPNYNTKLMNEGFATFTHYNIIYDLYRSGVINEGFMLEALDSHTGVCMQLPADHKRYSGHNPYYLGLNIFQDIRRICEKPTAEDKDYFPELVHTDYIEATKNAVKMFKDSSFIYQYLSPHLIRKLRLFEVRDIEDEPDYHITDIHNEEGYNSVKKTLSEQYELASWVPDLYVIDADVRGNRTLRIEARMRNRVKLKDESVLAVLKNTEFLWGYKVILSVVDEDGKPIIKYAL